MLRVLKILRFEVHFLRLKAIKVPDVCTCRPSKFRVMCILVVHEKTSGSNFLQSLSKSDTWFVYSFFCLLLFLSTPAIVVSFPNHSFRACQKNGSVKSSLGTRLLLLYVRPLLFCFSSPARLLWRHPLSKHPPLTSKIFQGDFQGNTQMLCV